MVAREQFRRWSRRYGRHGRSLSVKGRRLTRHNASRQMSAIRNLDKTPFDQLAGVLVDEGFRSFAPRSCPSRQIGSCGPHQRWKFFLRDEVWNLPDVRDVTDELRAVALTI